MAELEPISTTDNILNSEVINKWVKDITDDFFLQSFSELKDFYGAESVCLTSVQRSTESQSKNDRKRKMKLAFWLFVAIIFGNCLFHTVREVFSKTTILPASAPQPFFTAASRKYLDDYYTGNVRVDRLLRNNRITVVMFYAPWDRFSVKMRHSFEATARLMAHEKVVHFAAINCFVATGECRRTYKIYSYPVTVGYIGNVHAVYHGENAVDHFFRWVEKLVYPIEYLYNTNSAVSFALRYEYSILYYAPKEKLDSIEYRRYLGAAFQSNSGRPEDESVAFGIITAPSVAADFNLTGVRLICSSGERFTLEEFTIDSLVRWVKEKRTAPSTLHWITYNKNSELKTTQLADLINRTPLIVLVTVYQPLYQGQAEISMFKELALEYWKCGPEKKFMEEVFAATCAGFDVAHAQRKEQMLQDHHACNNAIVAGHEILECCRAVFTDIDSFCQDPPVLVWDEKVCVKSDCWEFGNPTENIRRNQWSGSVKISDPACASVTKISPGDVLKRCCEERARAASNPTLHPILLRDERLNREKFDILRCNKARLAAYLRYNSTSGYNATKTVDFHNENIAGLGCLFNESAQFAVLDSRQYRHFLNKWGVPNDGETRVVAIDTSQQLFAIMNDEVNPSSLRQFVLDYHDKMLTDYMLSEELTLSRFSGDYSLSQHGSGSLFIPKLTQSNFSMITNSNTTRNPDSVVFFSGGSWHGPSATLGYVFHTVSTYFLPNYANNIQFYMIDTSRNEVPYNFSFERLPTVIYFNGNRSDMSWCFPWEQSFTVSNLFSFIISHASPELKWKIVFQMCDQVCTRRNLRRLRRHSSLLQREIRQLREQSRASSPRKSYYLEQIIQRRVAQLRCVRAVLAVLSSFNKSQRDVAVSKLDDLLEKDLLLKYMMLANAPDLQ